MKKNEEVKTKLWNKVEKKIRKNQEEKRNGREKNHKKLSNCLINSNTTFMK